MKAEKPLGAMSEEEFSAYIERWREDWWNNNLGAWYKSYYAPLEFLHFSEEMSAEEVDQILTKLHSLISSGSIKACLDQLAIKICGDLKQYWNELFRLHVERLYPGYSIKTSMRFQNQHFVELREEIQYALESLYSTFPGLAASIEGYLTIKEGSMGRAFEKGMEGGAIGGTIGSILLGPIGFLAGAGIGGWLAGKSAQKELEASWGNFCQHLELFENQYN
ncbi:MAG: DUF456 domain-containing protein, partial [candidate division WOR-3 bacterium]